MEDIMQGEIRMFAGDFAPRGWAFCEGQLLPIADYTSLFSILGTNYGGDGRTTFGLPDLRGRTPKHQGQGPGLRDYRLGQKGGRETQTLSAGELPRHNHHTQLFAGGKAADSESAEGNMLAQTQAPNYTRPDANKVQLAEDSITSQDAGRGQAFSVANPYQVVSYIIALEGYFPSRS